MSKQASFKHRLQSGPAVLAPGVYDALTALIARWASENIGADGAAGTAAR